jgi:hypothetical protein
MIPPDTSQAPLLLLDPSPSPLVLPLQPAKVTLETANMQPTRRARCSFMANPPTPISSSSFGTSTRQAVISDYRQTAGPAPK